MVPLAPFKSGCKKALFIFLSRNSISYYSVGSNDIFYYLKYVQYEPYVIKKTFQNKKLLVFIEMSRINEINSFINSLTESTRIYLELEILSILKRW